LTALFAHATEAAGPPKQTRAEADRPLRQVRGFDGLARGNRPSQMANARRYKSFWTCKHILTLERHGARTLQGLRERILHRFCCLAAAITLNHQLGRPSRALVNYCA
jgi:hypothetical protein